MQKSKRHCPVCHSTKWRKEASSGSVLCSEGHVLQNYRSETLETNELGPHALRKRALKSSRTRKEKLSNANPKLYHGARASFHYYQCQQYILRLQIRNLIDQWKLPAEPFETICRDIWALHLALLPVPPPAEPLHHLDDQGFPSTSNNSSKEVPSKPSIDIHNASNMEKEDSDVSSESEKDTGDYASEVEQPSGRYDTDPQLARLLREASESDSDRSHTGSHSPDTRKPIHRRRLRGHPKHGGPAANIAVLVLACWTMRVPVIYKDFINLIDTYNLLYLEPIRFLPASMQEPLNATTRQALSPRHSPSAVAIHVVTSRLAKLLYQNYGIFTPELNAAPILWRAVRGLGGSSVLYVLAKALTSVLSLSLTLHHCLVPAENRSPNDQRNYQVGDSVPPELMLIGAVVVVYKLVYGLDGTQRFTNDPEDPACSMARATDFLHLLAGNLRASRELPQEIFSQTSQKSVLELSSEEIDIYLDFCDHALLSKEDVLRLDPAFGAVVPFFPLERPTKASNGFSIQMQETTRPSLQPTPEHRKPFSPVDKPAEPAEDIAIFNSHDILGMLPPEYELILESASQWAGSGKEDVGVLVEAFERRIMRWWDKTKRSERI